MLVSFLLNINFILDISLNWLRLKSVCFARSLFVCFTANQRISFYLGEMPLKKYHFPSISYWRNISFRGFPYQCDINAIWLVPGIKKRQWDHKGAMPVVCSFSSFTWDQYWLIHLSAICVKTTFGAMWNHFCAIQRRLLISNTIITGFLLLRLHIVLLCKVW